MSNSLAFVFPGQGSQFVGMLGDLAAQYSQIQETFDQASQALGKDLWELSQTGPESSLNQTDITQPALLTAGVALWRVWESQGGPQPGCMSGHSLGEYTALVCSGALQFADAVRLVNKRGQFMQSAVAPGEGAMAAILGLDDAAIAKACEEAAQGQVVSPVNFNSVGQVVIAGNTAAVERAIELCNQAGAKRAMPLPVSVPSHCSLMQPAAEKLEAELSGVSVSMPVVPVIQNLAAQAAKSAEDIKANLVKQLYRPVLWVDCVNTMCGLGVQRMIECGPGKVLSGLNKRINRQLDVASIGDVAGLSKALEN